MSWLTLDDRFLDHPKFVRLERRAPSRGVHLWLGLMSYCKQQLSDGIVPLDMLDEIKGPHPRWRRDALNALVAEELVHVDERSITIHDYLDWNDSRAAIERKSADRKARRHASSNPPSLQRDNELIARRDRGETEVRPSRDEVDNAVSARRDEVDNIPVSNDVASLNGVGTADIAERPRGRARGSQHQHQHQRDPDLPVSPLEAPAPPAPAKKKSRQPAASSGRLGAHRCPADFAPNVSTLAYATSLGFSEELEQRTRIEFVTWWQGEGRTKVDWQATYRNWLLKTAERRGLKPAKRDDRWREHQANLRRAERAPKPHERAPIPRDFESKVGSLFG